MGEDRALRYTVAVRTLCEFTAKHGDLDLRFTPTPSGREGVAGHGVVASRRAPPYECEVSLTGEYKALLVRGRADGYDPERNQLEEVKTFRGDLAAVPENHRHLHWAQAKIYGWLLCRKRGLTELRIALVYFCIVTQQETVFDELHTADALEQFYEEKCEQFLRFAQQELAHRVTRDRMLDALQFPHPEFRAGQRELAEAVYKSASVGCCVMAQAPTGIGKTIGTVFPLLKAWPRQALDKVFFLVAKTPGRKLALDALALIRRREPELKLRVLELVARDKACLHPDKACHGESCPLAKGFYDRLPQARQTALACDVLDQATTRSVAVEHGICPYFLSQDLARWSDVVVGDYNYYYDTSALLYALTLSSQWRVGVLVDEAHNLVERARRMYSAELDQADFQVVRQSAPAALKPTLGRLDGAWSRLHREQAVAYQAYTGISKTFLTALQQAITEITDHLSQAPAVIDGILQRFYFDALHFSRAAEWLDHDSLFDITKNDAPGPGARPRSPGAILSIRNIVPAQFLRPRFEAAHCTVLFSATLSPEHFYRDTLGLPGDTPWIDVQSPFSAEQLSVRVIDHVSTRFHHRDGSLSPIADVIAQQYEACPGNYLAFFSSFDYLCKVAALFGARYPDIPMWQQSRRMDEASRAQFLERFTRDGRGIGFAVLGGAFAEGIDLPGERLIGAFIATLGLPQLNEVNEQMKARMTATFGSGFEYTYLYPGIRKVVQAAGRVIRTRTDRGVVCLIDDRFRRPDVLRLLPAWWKVEARG